MMNSDMTRRELKQRTGIGQSVYLMSGHENVPQAYLHGETWSAIEKNESSQTWIADLF